MKDIGYDKDLFILAFDHRGSFRKISQIDTIDDEAVEKMKNFKNIIFKGFQKAVENGLPQECSAILVDELYGSGVATEAKDKGYMIAMPVEKSGQDVFDFDFGDKFKEHIERYDVDFVKVLIRYNPKNVEDNKVQNSRLKVLSDYCSENNRKFLLELLITDKSADTDKENFDRNIRPELIQQSIKEIQMAGVEPDLWKLEGFYRKEDYVNVMSVIRNSDSRKKVSFVTLGRGESDDVVKEWIRNSKGIEGVIGFAVGRTIFASAIESLALGKIGENEAVDIIASKYFDFYEEFVK